MSTALGRRLQLVSWPTNTSKLAENPCWLRRTPFRAGAVAWLVEWGRRVDVPVVTGPEKSDPASVVFDGVQRAVAEGVDILMIDTAGRLQNKDNLMAELEKIGRIIKRTLPDAPHETLLAMDASTGQNALSQAKEFAKDYPVNRSFVLTKLDGTAKGGVVPCYPSGVGYSC